jgi:hypothetical protein
MRGRASVATSFTCALKLLSTAKPNSGDLITHASSPCFLRSASRAFAVILPWALGVIGSSFYNDRTLAGGHQQDRRGRAGFPVAVLFD